jgi:hypothetical protein
MLVQLAREIPGKEITIAVLLAYNDPVSRNELNAPPAVLVKEHAQHASRELLVFDAVVFPFSTKKPFLFSRASVGKVVASYNKVVFKSADSSLNNTVVVFSQFIAINTDLYRTSQVQGPIAKVPFFRFKDELSSSTVSTTFTELTNFDLIPKGVAASIWVGSLVLQHVQHTYLLLNRAWMVSYKMAQYSYSPLPKKNTPPGSQNTRSNTYSSKKQAPAKLMNRLWVWYPENRPANISSFIKVLLSTALNVDQTLSFMEKLPINSGFYRATLKAVASKDKKSIAKVTIIYDDHPSAPQEAVAYYDEPAELTVPSLWGRVNMNRGRLYTSLPCSMQDQGSGFTAWGFEGVNAMGWLFTLPYYSDNDIPICHGPVRSPLIGKVKPPPQRKSGKDRSSRKQSSTGFEPSSVVPSDNKLYTVYTSLQQDAIQCRNDLIDYDQFEEAYPFPLEDDEDFQSVFLNPVHNEDDESDDESPSPGRRSTRSKYPSKIVDKATEKSIDSDVAVSPAPVPLQSKKATSPSTPPKASEVSPMKMKPYAGANSSDAESSNSDDSDDEISLSQTRGKRGKQTVPTSKTEKTSKNGKGNEKGKRATKRQASASTRLSPRTKKQK